MNLADLLNNTEFHARHIGPDESSEPHMLKTLGVATREALISEVVPKHIRANKELALKDLPSALTEVEALARLRTYANENQVWRSYIGTGYYNTITPQVILRNVFENPGWYTAYTPYQAEISQGRMEALMNFQQMIIDLTGLDIANASLLDEATAAAEAMTVMKRAADSQATAFFVDRYTHPQVIAVIQTRAKWMDIEVIVGDATTMDATQVFGAHLQYPNTNGELVDWTGIATKLHAAKALVCIGTDLLALMLVKSPGAMGADIAIGNAQRFGVPLGYGGPHAAFMSVKDEFKRMMPGRIIGVSVDASGRPAYRMSLQTREQHIRRDKATSNICTAQALLANMAGFYATYHGPSGLKRIAMRTHFMAQVLTAAVSSKFKPQHANYFDTLVFDVGSELANIQARLAAKRINLRVNGTHLGVSVDETTTLNDVSDIASALLGTHVDTQAIAAKLNVSTSFTADFTRKDAVLKHPVFNRYHTETEMMRYLKRLENKDISLVHSMISLGSCTMKLNAASEMAPVSWPEFGAIHPFAPVAQAKGYKRMIEELNAWLEEITGFAAVSMQPNSGAQGEYAGLIAILNYLEAKGQGHRKVCLIPSSAHGTNPASAMMLGMQIVVVKCDDQGNIDVIDLASKIELHKTNLAALMITYPSTHGVFESAVKDICAAVHAAGGQVYMDGANLNAQAGLTSPGIIGADVCHMNLHKTFCIPHGGGGPGMGPIAVAAHLAPHLPTHAFMDGSSKNNGTVSAAPYGSASITVISWMYIAMMGGVGIRKATEYAILNANYMAKRIAPYFPILYTGENGRVAHECILDMRHLKAEYGVGAEDIAKRLMDYGFHSPTMSFPVTDTLMVEPTESESKAELDRFCDAMISIHGELQAIKSGLFDKSDNPLKNAPHTAGEAMGDWNHSYSREQAYYPLPYVAQAKYWPPVKRIDNAAGDRNLICTCPPVSDFDESEQKAA